MLGSKRAVVLAGGGSRGAYQAGVWQALRECGVEYGIVTGTSVGALNGAMMVQGDLEETLRLWARLTAQDVANVDLSRATENGRPGAAVYAEFLRQAALGGGVDISGLESLMRAVIDEGKFFASPIDYGLITVEYPSFQPAALKKSDIPHGKLCDYLIASASCFPAFPTKLIDEVQYIDGGYHDNMPVNLAVELGAQEVIAVDLEAVGLRKRPRLRASGLTVIRPVHPLGPFLLFEPDSAQRNIRLGYLDALRALGRAEGGFITLRRGETARLLDAMRSQLLWVSSLLSEKGGGALWKAAGSRDGDGAGNVPPGSGIPGGVEYAAGDMPGNGCPANGGDSLDRGDSPGGGSPCGEAAAYGEAPARDCENPAYAQDDPIPGSERLRGAIQHLAQWYELDVETLYTAHSYCYELLLRFNAAEPLLSEEILTEFQSGPKGLAQRLSAFGHKRLAEHLFVRLKDLAFERCTAEEWLFMAAALKEEAAAAVFLFALKAYLASEDALDGIS